MCHNIHNFGRLFLAHDYYNLYAQRQKKVYRNNVFSMYDQFGHTRAETPTTEIIKFTLLIHFDLNAYSF